MPKRPTTTSPTASPSSKKRRPTRAAAQRASDAVQSEAENVAGYDDIPEEQPTRRPALKKKKSGSGKPPARAPKKAPVARLVFNNLKKKSSTDVFGQASTRDGNDARDPRADDEDEIRPAVAVEKPRGSKSGTAPSSEYVPDDAREDEQEIASAVPSGNTRAQAGRRASSTVRARHPSGDEEDAVPDAEEARRAAVSSSVKPRGAVNGRGEEQPGTERTSRNTADAHVEDDDAPPEQGPDVGSPNRSPPPEGSAAERNMDPIRNESGGDNDGVGRRKHLSARARSNPRARASDVIIRGPSPDCNEDPLLPSRLEEDLPTQVSRIVRSVSRSEVSLTSIARDLSEVKTRVDDRFEDVLFRIATLESLLEDIRAKPSEGKQDGGPECSGRRGEGGISGWESLMEAKFPHLLSYFPVQLWRHAILFATFEHIWTTTTEEFDMGEGTTVFSTLLFARSNKGKKEVYKTPVGERASMFRNTILSTALDLARARTYPVVKPDSPAVALDDKPFWLGRHGKDHYILEEHMLNGQLFHETKTSNTPGYNRRVAIGDGAEPGRDDYANFVMIKLYKVMNDMLSNNRKRVKDDFCQVFGYLFTEWNSNAAGNVSSDSVSLYWNVPFENVVRLSSDKIDEAMTADTESISADSSNRTLYKHVRDRKDLRLFLSHDILVRPAATVSDAKRKTPGAIVGSPKFFRRWLNLVTPAAVFLLALAGMPPSTEAHALLRFHPHSMRVLYNIALFLRDVYDLHPARAMCNGVQTKERSGRTMPTDLTEQIDSFFRSLVPGKSQFDRVMEVSVGGVDGKFFRDHHVPSKDERVSAARADARARSVEKPARANGDRSATHSLRRPTLAGRSSAPPNSVGADVPQGSVPSSSGGRATVLQKEASAVVPGRRNRSPTAGAAVDVQASPIVGARQSSRSDAPAQQRQRQGSGSGSAVPLHSTTARHDPGSVTPEPDEDVVLIDQADRPSDAEAWAKKCVASLVLDDDDEHEPTPGSVETRRAAVGRDGRAQLAQDVIVPAKKTAVNGKNGDTAPEEESDAEQRSGEEDESEL